jgi:hypothetical protein
LGETPTSRSGHCAVMLGTRMLLFGGFSRDGFLNDLHAFDTAPGGLAAVKVKPGEGTHSSIHRAQARAYTRPLSQLSCFIRLN